MEGCRPFEGRVTRREWLGRVGALAAGSLAVPGLRAQTGGAFQWAPLIDHIQINSDNVRASTEFYQKVLGLDLLRLGPPNDPKCCPDESSFFGVGSRLILAIRKLPGRNIDHYSLMMKGFEQKSFTAALSQRGAAPAKHGLPGYYVADPDGMLIQMMSEPGPAGPNAPTPGASGSMRFEWEPLIDHVQVNSADVRKSTEYYQKVLGLDLLRLGPPNDRNCCPDTSAFFGVGKRLILAIRKQEPLKIIDHYALLMKNFNRDAVDKELRARGATPKQTPETGYYVEDPDGIKIQLMGQPGPA